MKGRDFFKPGGIYRVLENAGGERLVWGGETPSAGDELRFLVFIEGPHSTSISLRFASVKNLEEVKTIGYDYGKEEPNWSDYFQFAGMWYDQI